MDWINKKIVVFAVVLSLVTTGFIFAYINSFKKSSIPGEMVRIYVAEKNIEARGKITVADIKLIEIDKKYLQNGAITRKEELVGKRVKETILKGEQIVKDRLGEENKMTLAYRIPKGKRAVSLDITEASSVAYNIQPGDYVDLAATFQKEDEEEAAIKVTYPKMTKLIFQNIMVLGMGVNSQSSEKDAKKETPKTITLAVDVKDAEKLIYASEDCSLKFLLRPVDDTETIDASGKIRKDVSGTKGIIKLAK